MGRDGVGGQRGGSLGLVWSPGKTLGPRGEVDRDHWSRLCWRWVEPTLLPAIVDGPGDFAFEAGAGDDAVDEAVGEEELAGLDAFGKLQADGGFDGAGAGEADEGFGLGKDQVAERGEAGRDAAHRGIGEDGDEQA